jgi:hypothetical protein
MIKFIEIMKKQLSILLLLAIFLLTACEKSLLREDELLRKRDAVETATPDLLISSVIQQSAFVYQREGGVDNKTLACAVQYMQGNRSSDDNVYKSWAKPKDDLYGITAPIKLVQSAIDQMHDKGLKSYEGVFLIFKSLLWSVATDLYGDVYYTEGLRGQEGILFPTFDEQKNIYPELIKNLRDATVLLTEGTDQLDKTYDVLYGGDKTKWIKFANSLRLRLLMRESKNLPNVADSIAAVAALPLITLNAENASIPYFANEAFRWPMSVDGYNENFQIYRPCKTLVDSLKALNDSRLYVWTSPMEKPWTDSPSQNGVVVNTTDPNNFTYSSVYEYIDLTKPGISGAASFIVDKNTLYAGYAAGSYENVLAANGSYDFPTTIYNYKISKFSKLLNERSHSLLKACMIQADEVQFLLAEAAVKGYISSANAETYYKKGVQLAQARWGVTTPSDYFNNAPAKFPATGTDSQKLAKIALQKWLGHFLMGVEAYVDHRRTRLPAFESNGEFKNNPKPFPLRFMYPQSEINNNSESYQEAVARLDKGDDPLSSMWLIK